MNKKEFLKKIGDIEIIYSLPLFVKNYKNEHHALVQYKMLSFDLEHEIERLNNIINELEKWLEEGMNYSDYYEGDLSDIYEEIYDHLQELKENS